MESRIGLVDGAVQVEIRVVPWSKSEDIGNAEFFSHRRHLGGWVGGWVGGWERKRKRRVYMGGWTDLLIESIVKLGKEEEGKS